MLAVIDGKSLNKISEREEKNLTFTGCSYLVYLIFIFSTFSVGRPKHTRVMAGALEGELFIGPKAEEYRGLLNIKYPMEHGIVTDWNDMERIWQYIYSKEQLQTFSEEVSHFDLYL